MPKCTEYNCKNEVQARGLCSGHYGRWLHSEEGERLKMKGYGNRRKHPLYEAWRTMNRMPIGAVCEEWKDFWVFVNEMGDKPSKHYIMTKKDKNLPHCKENSEWKEKIVLKDKTDDERAYRAKYMREHRKLQPDLYRNMELKKRFGITIDDYNKMLENQKGLCEICNKKPDGDTNKTRILAVDHCHESGKIRALLCNLCNSALGGFKDNIQNLKNAIVYLEKHQ